MLKTRIYLQISVPIQPRTSEMLPTICQKIGNYSTPSLGSRQPPGRRAARPRHVREEPWIRTPPSPRKPRSYAAQVRLQAYDHPGCKICRKFAKSCATYPEFSDIMISEIIHFRLFFASPLRPSRPPASRAARRRRRRTRTTSSAPCSRRV